MKATAEQTSIMVVEPKEAPAVRLTMSPEAAKALCAVTWFISGDPRTTRRRHLDEIRRALREAGVDGSLPEDVRRPSNITFEPR
jgi:hypothetical protein